MYDMSILNDETREVIINLLGSMSDEDFKTIKDAFLNTIKASLANMQGIDDFLKDIDNTTIGALKESSALLKNRFKTEITELQSEIDKDKEPNKYDFYNEIYLLVEDYVDSIVREADYRVFSLVKVDVEKCHENARLPIYAHEGDQGADIYAIEDYEIKPRSYGNKIRTGLKLRIPEGWAVAIRPRSGMSAKTPLRISNAPATIDTGYRGEVMVLFDNFSDEAVMIHSGDRIAQFVLEKNYRATFREDTVDLSTERGEGGFGSTGA